MKDKSYPQTVYRMVRILSSRFRKKRMNFFLQLFPWLSAETRVLDVGGTMHIWTFAPVKPKLTIVNIVPPEEPVSGAEWVVADGRNLPFADREFDIAFSNSVIEHVGTWEDQQAFAREIRRVAKYYFVQTPNKQFPFEMHLRTPLIHYLPRHWQKRLLRNFTVWGWFTRPHPARCEQRLNRLRLLNAKEMKALFPDASLLRERFLGLTKSLIAVRR